MTCRRCKSPYDPRGNQTCPYCGEPRPRPRPAFLKTSTILISTSAARRIYRSLDEIPATLRSKLLKSTNGVNSATILIADRKGREEIAQAVRRLPGRAGHSHTPAGFDASRLVSIHAIRRTAGIILALLAVLSLWAVLGWPWN